MLGQLVHSNCKKCKRQPAMSNWCNSRVSASFIRRADLICVSSRAHGTRACKGGQRAYRVTQWRAHWAYATAFGGQKVQCMAQRAVKPAQPPVVQGAAVTQRLKPGKPPGTQRLTPKQAPALPSGTQVKKKVRTPEGQLKCSATVCWAYHSRLCGPLPAIVHRPVRRRQGGPARSQAGCGQPRLLARLEQLRLLSKAEQAGLLSLAERNGLTLTFIEESGEQPVHQAWRHGFCHSQQRSVEPERESGSMTC